MSKLTKAFFIKYHAEICNLFSEHNVDIDQTFLMLDAFDLSDIAPHRSLKIHYKTKKNCIVDELALSEYFESFCLLHGVTEKALFSPKTLGSEALKATLLKDLNNNIIEICQPTAYSPHSLVIFRPDLLDEIIGAFDPTLKPFGPEGNGCITSHSDYVSLDLTRDELYRPCDSHDERYLSVWLLDRLSRRQEAAIPYIQSFLEQVEVIRKKVTIAAKLYILKDALPNDLVKLVADYLPRPSTAMILYNLDFHSKSPIHSLELSADRLYINPTFPRFDIIEQDRTLKSLAANVGKKQMDIITRHSLKTNLDLTVTRINSYSDIHQVQVDLNNTRLIYDHKNETSSVRSQHASSGLFSFISSLSTHFALSKDTEKAFTKLPQAVALNKSTSDMQLQKPSSRETSVEQKEFKIASAILDKLNIVPSTYEQNTSLYIGPPEHCNYAKVKFTKKDVDALEKVLKYNKILPVVESITFQGMDLDEHSGTETLFAIFKNFPNLTSVMFVGFPMNKPTATFEPAKMDSKATLSFITSLVKDKPWLIHPSIFNVKARKGKTDKKIELQIAEIHEAIKPIIEARNKSRPEAVVREYLKGLGLGLKI